MCMLTKLEYFKNKCVGPMTQDGTFVETGGRYWMYNPAIEDCVEVTCSRVLDNGGADFYYDGQKVSLSGPRLKNIYSDKAAVKLPTNPLMKMHMISNMNNIGLDVKTIKCKNGGGYLKFESNNHVYKCKWSIDSEKVEVEICGDGFKRSVCEYKKCEIEDLCKLIKYVAIDWMV